MQQCVTRHGGQHEGGALVMVAEHDGQVEGFIVGMLDRVYHIGDRLASLGVVVEVTEDGLKFEGKAYTSLTAIAKAVTGYAAISGPNFFGLWKRAEVK